MRAASDGPAALQAGRQKFFMTSVVRAPKPTFSKVWSTDVHDSCNRFALDLFFEARAWLFPSWARYSYPNMSTSLLVESATRSGQKIVGGEFEERFAPKRGRARSGRAWRDIAALGRFRISVGRDFFDFRRFRVSTRFLSCENPEPRKSKNSRSAFPRGLADFSRPG